MISAIYFQMIQKKNEKGQESVGEKAHVAKSK